MNKRQKKKKGLLLIKKTYSNWGNKKNKSTEKKDVKKVSKKDAGYDPYGLAEAWWTIFTKPDVTNKKTR